MKRWYLDAISGVWYGLPAVDDDGPLVERVGHVIADDLDKADERFRIIRAAEIRPCFHADLLNRARRAVLKFKIQFHFKMIKPIKNHFN